MHSVSPSVPHACFGYGRSTSHWLTWSLSLAIMSYQSIDQEGISAKGLERPTRLRVFAATLEMDTCLARSENQRRDGTQVAMSTGVKKMTPIGFSDALQQDQDVCLFSTLGRPVSLDQDRPACDHSITNPNSKCPRSLILPS
jgi:hypothetical protein